MNINRNIAVWRGDEIPPTIYHIWIKDDNSIWLYKIDKWVNINELTEETLINIYEVLYNQHSLINFSASKAIIEKGVAATVDLNWSVKFNGNTITPKSSILKSGDTVLIENTLSYSEAIEDTKKYNLTVTLDYGVQKLASVLINAYYPMFFGSSIFNNITENDILSFNKQNIKSTPAGTYSLNVENNLYVWLCVPSTMNINKVLSSGFDVPMETPVIVAVSGKNTYKCYRSSNAFKSGIFNFTII